jgi:hypothetical protein
LAEYEIITPSDDPLLRQLEEAACEIRPASSAALGVSFERALFSPRLVPGLG